MRWRPLSRDGMEGTGVAFGRGCTGREPRFSGARGRRWTLMELSPGDSSRRHWGDGRLPPPHAASLPALRLLRRGRFLGGLGIRLRVLRGLLLPGAEGHGLDAERQDADAARVDLPGLARLILVRSEEHTSELQSLMRISYAVFC